MNTTTHNLPLALVRHPTGITWLGHLKWVAGLAILGFAVPAEFVGVFQLPRTIYLVFYFGLTGAFLYGYRHWSSLNLEKLFVEHWPWGLIGGVILSVFTINTVLMQQGSPAPSGLELWFDLGWLGLLYGIVDALVLSVMPVCAACRALALLGWTKHWPGRIGAGVVALLVSMLVIALYHLGYPECRGPQVLIIIVGVAAQSFAYLLTRNPLTPVIGHVAMHVAAVLYGLNTVSQLPPHY